jgi:hypothetical protein
MSSNPTDLYGLRCLIALKHPNQKQELKMKNSDDDEMVGNTAG